MWIQVQDAWLVQWLKVWPMSGTAWVRFPQLRNFAKFWKFADEAPVFESRKAPAGNFRLGARLSKLEPSWSRLVVF